MAFEGLSSKFQNIARKFKGKTRITESDLKEMLREVKLALLEADVNYKIVKEFIATIQEKALGQDVLKSLTPGQQVIKIVKDELVELLGGTDARINISPDPCKPTIIIIVGGFGVKFTLLSTPPNNSTNSSFTIFTTCCPGVNDFNTSCPNAFSCIVLINSFTIL